MEKRFKIVLLGEGRVGKTSLIRRYIMDEFSPDQKSTLNATFFTKHLIINDQRVVLHIWDTAGQERFHTLGPIYYRESDGAVLTYDITDADSLDRAVNWARELRSSVGDIPVLLVGNKYDLRHGAVEEPREVMARIRADHLFASAKSGRNVDQIFSNLTTKILQRKASSPVTGRSGLVIEPDDDDTPEPDGTCPC